MLLQMQAHGMARSCHPGWRRSVPQGPFKATKGRGRMPHAIRAQSVAAPQASPSTTSGPSSAASKMSQVVMWNGQRLQTQALPVAKDTIAIRSLDWDRDRFDIEFGLENGTTYNAYLIIGGDKVALVDASHEKFASDDLFINTLQEQLRAAGRDKIDYILISHTEPDHSGLVPAVVSEHPGATVVGSKVALNFLRGLTHEPFSERAVKGGDKLDLGGGHELEFVMAPNLHWPDTIFTYDHGSGLLLTCDAFGSHYCTEDPLDSDLQTLLPHYRFYYDCLMRPNARSVTTALRKVKDLPFTAIATGHGPVLRLNVPELVSRYAEWSAAMGTATTTVAVMYCSEYGYSDRLSQTLARGVTKAGVQTEMVDLLSADPHDLQAIVGRCKGVILMAPPSSSTEARTSLAALTSAIKPGTKVLVAESYGGADEPVDLLVSGLLAAGAEPVAGAALRVKEVPRQALYQEFEEAGTDLAQALTAKDVIARKKGAMDMDTARALARLSSGLYVVTAARRETAGSGADGASGGGTESGGAGEGSSSSAAAAAETAAARSAMVASWVAQASFEPLGFTVAVAKDRAIESLMQVGDTFVLNVLGEDASQHEVMKHFLKRFGPGADRFAGVEWFPARNGSPVLKKAIAYMECKVVSRMEVPDHWVTYCEVTDGAVMQPETRTAVHTRKVANYY